MVLVSTLLKILWTIPGLDLLPNSFFCRPDKQTNSDGLDESVEAVLRATGTRTASREFTYGSVQQHVFILSTNGLTEHLSFRILLFTIDHSKISLLELKSNKQSVSIPLPFPKQII